MLGEKLLEREQVETEKQLILQMDLTSYEKEGLIAEAKIRLRLGGLGRMISILETRILKLEQQGHGS